MDAIQRAVERALHTVCCKRGNSVAFMSRGAFTHLNDISLLSGSFWVALQGVVWVRGWDELYGFSDHDRYVYCFRCFSLPNSVLLTMLRKDRTLIALIVGIDMAISNKCKTRQLSAGGR